jgi:ribosome maturation factor RimP
MPSVASQALANRLAQLGERAVADSGVELVEIELRGAGKARLVRVYIDKPGGVTHADCEFVSGRLGQLLDDEDAIPEDSYTLEVSSPGVERRLSKARDFERVVGRPIRVALREPVSGLKRVEGKLVGFVAETLDVETSSGDTIHVPLGQVQKANLKFEW